MQDDEAGVRSAVSSEWSNGQTEGQVNHQLGKATPSKKTSGRLEACVINAALRLSQQYVYCRMLAVNLNGNDFPQRQLFAPPSALAMDYGNNNQLRAPVRDRALCCTMGMPATY